MHWNRIFFVSYYTIPKCKHKRQQCPWTYSIATSCVLLYDRVHFQLVSSAAVHSPRPTKKHTNRRGLSEYPSIPCHFELYPLCSGGAHINRPAKNIQHTQKHTLTRPILCIAYSQEDIRVTAIEPAKDCPHEWFPAISEPHDCRRHEFITARHVTIW